MDSVGVLSFIRRWDVLDRKSGVLAFSWSGAEGGGGQTKVRGAGVELDRSGDGRTRLGQLCLDLGKLLLVVVSDVLIGLPGHGAQLDQL